MFVSFRATGGLGVIAVVMIEVACLFSVIALGFVASVIQKAGGKISDRTGTVWALMMLLMKLPLTLGGLWAGWFLLGGAWLPFFGTIGLVYSATVWNLASPRFRGNQLP
jgi:hypothetical protein